MGGLLPARPLRRLRVVMFEWAQFPSLHLLVSPDLEPAMSGARLHLGSAQRQVELVPW